MLSTTIKILFCCFCLAALQPAVAQQPFTNDDFSHWLQAAYIAQATYQSEEDVKKLIEPQGFTIKHFQQVEGFSVAYVLATNTQKKQHILAVRGTSNVENAVVDAAFVLVADKLSGIDIHQGFLLSARDIYQQVLPDIDPDYEITTIGHSLGGASALILAMMLDAHGYRIAEVITFGQPKVTNISGALKYSHLNIKRLVTPKDIVPLVPPVDPMDMMKFSIFWHQGTEIVLYRDNRYSVLTGIDSMLRATSFLNELPGPQHLSNHFMSSYIGHLKEKLTDPQASTYKNEFKFSDWFGTTEKTDSSNSSR